VGAAGPPGAAPAAHRGRPARPRLVLHRGRYDVGTGRALTVHGTLLPRARGRRVVVEAVLGSRWRPLAQARTRANGHFRITLTARWLGVVRVQVRARGGLRADAGVVRAYRPTLASWYALYGSPLACGGTLRYEQLGVANRTLPCGTKVTLRYRGRVVTVPVIDRGPYVGGREWDLTGATARRLGFDGVGVVWSTR
jgi:rare lipoprotein A